MEIEHKGRSAHAIHYVPSAGAHVARDVVRKQSRARSCLGLLEEILLPTGNPRGFPLVFTQG